METAIVDEKGFFSINAMINDTLLFGCNDFEYKPTGINKKDYDTGIFEIQLILNSTMLKEITIAKYPQINALSRGIIVKPVKKYTVQERRCFLATSNPILSLINNIIGNVEMLKKNIETEKK